MIVVEAVTDDADYLPFVRLRMKDDNERGVTVTFPLEEAQELFDKLGNAVEEAEDAADGS